jgi:hypothetical protein
MSYFTQGGITGVSALTTLFSLTIIGRRRIWSAFGPHGSHGHSDPSSRPKMGFKDRYFQHPDRYDRNKPSDCRFRMKHDIFGLGVVLLELQKNRSFSDVRGIEPGWGDMDGQGRKREFLKLLFRDGINQLGDEFVSPIAQCFSGFEELDTGEDAICHPRVLRHFRAKVLDPLDKVADNPPSIFSGSTRTG